MVLLLSQSRMSRTIRLFRLCLDEIEVGACHDLLIIPRCQTESCSAFPYLKDSSFQSPEQDFDKAIERLSPAQPQGCPRECRAKPACRVDIFRSPAQKTVRTDHSPEGSAVCCCANDRFPFQSGPPVETRWVPRLSGRTQRSPRPSEVDLRSGATRHSARRSPLSAGPCIRTVSMGCSG